ncbi:MAG: Zn-dependent exopeptidase M28 [Treponema sp.]|jgi:hypothetical protein|nr:Zn-dependent exopeptidase M28 [Treponema sp.]
MRSREWPTSYERLEEFTAPFADRRQILCSILQERGLPYTPVDIAGNRHIFVGELPRELPGGESGGTVLTAHYDRADGSPGANDNSAAVFQLVDAAVRLRAGGGPGNWLMVFTDKEELRPGESLDKQGSYGLAGALGDQNIFIFDACGVGESLVISLTVDYLLKDIKNSEALKLRERTRRLRNRALETARGMAPGTGPAQVILAPTPFSDDAGFLRAGMAAQTLTVLPAGEAAAFKALLKERPGLAEQVLNPRSRRLLPRTWQSLNGPGDSLRKLTPRHFNGIAEFICALCRGKPGEPGLAGLAGQVYMPNIPL